MLSRRRGISAVALALVVMAASCSTEDGGETEGIKIVATTTMLGDIARNVVGDDGSVQVLFSVGTSPHDFQPTSAQVTAIYEADLVLANGLYLEEALLDVLHTAQADGVNVVEIAELLDPLTFGDRAPCSIGEDEKSSNATCDPHVWLDPERNSLSAEIVARMLTEIDSSVAWADRATAYASDLATADAAIVEVLDQIPIPDRLLVTNHDSLGYFSDRYGFVVVGTVIPGGSTLSEPSSADLANLVAVINETGVSAIFAETSEPKALAEAIAREADHEVTVVSLYTGSLGEDGSGAETLVSMLLTNAERIANGLS